MWSESDGSIERPRVILGQIRSRSRSGSFHMPEEDPRQEKENKKNDGSEQMEHHEMNESSEEMGVTERRRENQVRRVKDESESSKTRQHS